MAIAVNPTDAGYRQNASLLIGQNWEWQAKKLGNRCVWTRHRDGSDDTAIQAYARTRPRPTS